MWKIEKRMQRTINETIPKQFGSEQNDGRSASVC